MTGDGAIRALDERTVEQIAAGEVVDRPASVVKELVENALDAGASRIDVTAAAGGTDSLAVADDGVGMSREAVKRAVEQHTTSKIGDVADLEAGVETLGFRGEALHAIGAVSRLTITSRTDGSEAGTELRVEGGDVVDVGPAGRPPGTTVAVEDLFFNVPARRKYLESASTEFAHCSRVVRNYALANPDVAVSLTHDDRETFATPGQGDLREAVLAVYGGEVARAMAPVDGRAAGVTGPDSGGEATDASDGTATPAARGTGWWPDDAGGARVELPDGPLDAVTGLVSHPETTRASREYVTTLINGRYVRSDAVREAVVEAYGGQLSPDRYPFAVLFCHLDPGAVDVNVHPRKLDVRFADEAGLRDQVAVAVESALVEAGMVRSGAPRGKSAPDQATLAPGEDDGDGDHGEDDEAGQSVASTERSDQNRPGGERRTADESEEKDADRRSDDTPTAAGSQRSSEASDGDDTASDASTAVSASRTPADRASTASQADAAAESETSPGTTAESTDGTGPSTAEADRSTAGTGRSTAETGRSTTATDADRTDRREPEETDRSERVAPGCQAGGIQPSANEGGLGGTEQARLGDAPDADRFETLPPLRVLGQLAETYVVAATDDGLALIDQHAADERVNYERLCATVRDDPAVQTLAEPVTISVTAAEADRCATQAEELADLGIEAERSGEREVTVSAIPALLADASGPELVRDVLAALGEGRYAAATAVEDALDSVLADLSCHPSVTGNTSLSAGSIEALLSALEDCENPYSCPHGRPTIVRIDADEIEARFERDYPGHQQRRE